MKSLQLIGHVGADPESPTQAGFIMTKFSVATTHSWLEKTGERKTVTEWHRVVCFNKLAEIANSSLHKGSKVYIAGKLKTSKWQDKKNETRYTTEVVADDLIMLDAKSIEETIPLEEAV